MKITLLIQKMSNIEKYIEEYSKTSGISDSDKELLKDFLSNTKLIKNTYFRGYDDALKDVKEERLFKSNM